jgi:hypothetical protein
MSSFRSSIATEVGAVRAVEVNTTWRICLPPSCAGRWSVAVTVAAGWVELFESVMA